MEDGPAVWASANHMGDPDEALGFGLAQPCHCSCLGSEPIEDLCLFSPSLTQTFK